MAARRMSPAFLARAVDIAHRLEQACTRVQTRLHADVVGVAIRDPVGRQDICVVYGDQAGTLRRLIVEPPKGLGGLVSACLKPMAVNDYLVANEIDHDPMLDRAVEAEGIRASLAIPIPDTGTDPRTLAGILYGWRRNKREFELQDKLTGERLAHQICTAVSALHVCARGSTFAFERLSTLVHALSEQATTVGDEELLLSAATQTQEVQPVLDRLSWLLKKPVVVIDPEGRATVLGNIRPPRDWIEAVLNLVRAGRVGATLTPRTPPLSAVHATPFGHFLLTALRLPAQQLSYLAVLTGDQPTVRTIRLARFSALLAELIAIAPRETVTTQKDAIRRLFSSLLKADPPLKDQDLLRMSEQMGISLSKYHHLMVITSPGSESVFCERHLSVVEEVARQMGYSVIAATLDQSLVCLAGVSDASIRVPRQMQSLASAALKRLRPSIDRSHKLLAVIAGGCREVRDFPAVYQQAQACAKATPTEGPDMRVTDLDALGPLRIFLDPASTAQLRWHVDKWLGVLLDHDRRHGTSYVQTLEAYLAANRRRSTAAKALFIHAHTLEYRLRRIKELTGYDLADSEVLFNLQFALRAMKVVAP